MVKAVRHEDHEARHHRIAKAATGLAGLADQHADESNARPQESKSNMIDVALDGTTLQRWRASPISFVEEVLHDPETGKPFVLLPRRGAFMQHAFALDDDGRLDVSRTVLRRTEEVGKTTLAAMIVLVMVLLRNDARFGEGLLRSERLRSGGVARVRGDQAHCRGVAAVEGRGAGSPPTRSCFRRSMRRSRRLRATRRLRLAATR